MLEDSRANEMADIDAKPAPAPAADQRLALRSALGRFATGVTVVTTMTPDGPIGITANSFSSVSLDPPLVLWSIGRHSKRFDAFAGAHHYAIHVLGADQDELCWRFSRSGSDFEGLDLERGRHGEPLLRGALARFECRMENRFEGGDHLILVGRVMRLTERDGEPLIFAGSRQRHLAPLI